MNQNAPASWDCLHLRVLVRNKSSLSFIHHSYNPHAPSEYIFKKILKALVESLCEDWCSEKVITSSSVPTTIVMAWKTVQAQLVKHLLTFISHLPRTFLAGLVSHLQLQHKLRADLIIISLCSRCKNKYQP